MKQFIVIITILFALCTAASFSPNSEAGMISVSVDGESLQNLLSVYENSGFHDFGTTEKIDSVDIIKRIDKYYFYNWKIDLNDDDLKFNMDGTLNAQAEYDWRSITFHPYGKTNGISAVANAFFKDFGLSDDGKIHLSVYIADAGVDISDLSYGYGFIIDKLFIDGLLGVDDYIEAEVQSRVKNTLEQMTDALNCIDITNQIAVSFPNLSKEVKINHADTKVENNKIYAYGCPISKKMIGDQVVINDTQCENVIYNISVWTATDIGNAGTKSKTKVSLCGRDITGSNKCIDNIDLNNWTQQGQSHRHIQKPFVLIDDLSVTLESDNSRSDDWYVDSVTVDMKLPNNKTFHYWFPIHKWIGGLIAPSSYTFKQNDDFQVYTFRVETGNQSEFDGAGTDSDILAEACDINDKCLLFNLDKDNYNDFESGSNTTYTIITKKKLDNLKSLTLHNVHNGSDNPGWYVQDVLYLHYSFPENIDHSVKDGQGFMFRQWLAKGEYKDSYYRTEMDRSFTSIIGRSDLYLRHDISVKRQTNNNFGYNVTVKTKAGGASGTDADIILTIEGCSGEKEIFNLNNDRNNFEKGNLDNFRLSGKKDLKGMKRLTLYNDGSGDGPGWNPDTLQVSLISYQGEYIVQYAKDEATGFETGVYNKPFFYVFTKNIAAGETWTSPELACPEIEKPTINSFIYETYPGDYIKITGNNLDKAHDIKIVLNKTTKPILVTRDYALIQIPDDTPQGDYDWGSVILDSVVQSVFIHVRKQKPVLDGLAISVAEPGEIFEASMHNIDSSASFYLGDNQLEVLDVSKQGVYLQIPKTMENGVYKFRAVSNGWDVVYDETIEIIKSIVPHVSSISDNPVYTGQMVTIYGKNFGEDASSIHVLVGDKLAEITFLKDEKITIQIPSGVSGNDITVSVDREDVFAPEVIKIEIKGLPWFMSFDDKEHPWTSKNAELSYDASIKQGDVGYSLKIHGDGYKSIVSPKFNTYELNYVSNTLLLDVWIPEIQTNPYWYGDVQMSINIPAAGLYNSWINQVLLTGLQPGWNTLSFELNHEIYKALSGNYSNVSITIILNANQNLDDFRIDNLRFDGDIKIRATRRTVASSNINILQVASR